MRLEPIELTDKSPSILERDLNLGLRFVDDDVGVGQDEAVGPHDEPGPVAGGQRLPGVVVLNVEIFDLDKW